MVGVLRRLWADDAGAVIASEYLLLGVVVVLGGSAGLVAIRDQSVASMEDYGRSVRSIGQAYTVPAVRNGVAAREGSRAEDCRCKDEWLSP